MTKPTSTTAHPALARFLAAQADTSRPDSIDGALARCDTLAALLDELLIELAGDNPPFAVVAVGGTGRQEQCRHSDIDVMLLVPRDDRGEAARCLYPLWDAQLKVGHSVRTIEQALGAAEVNVETFTALLDARFLHGDLVLFERFREAWTKFTRQRRAWLHEELATLRRQTREREPWQVMAVDVKQSRGGLRDLQALHWLDRASPEVPAPPLPPEIEAARRHLLATRAAVHALVERPSDVYRQENAQAVATWLGVDAFEWGRDLYQSMRTIERYVDTRFEEAKPHITSRRTFGFRLPWQHANEDAPAPAPESGPEPGDLNSLLDRLHRVEEGGPLEQMPPSAALDRLLPEWEVLRSRPHIAPFHINPVDIHVLRCVAEAHRAIQEDEFDTGTPEVARAFGRPDEVLLAAFLHDIGKGHSGDHSIVGAVIVERFAARAGLDAAVSQRLVTTVREHLLLPGVATRRDIADEAVLSETADALGDVDTLRLAYLLAVADARASGPNVWSAWKAQLLRTLFHRLLNLLDVNSQDTASARMEAVTGALAARFPATTVRGHLDGMGADYLLSTQPATIGDHIGMIEALTTAGGPSTVTRHDRVGQVDRVTLVTRDRPGLLQTITGTLAGHHASVHGGVAYTRTDGIAIQVWHVGDALGSGFEERRWQRLLAALPAAIEGTYSVEARLAEVRASYPEPPRANVPTSILIDNNASREHTILEISTADRRGLLYALTRVLHEQGIDIHLAKVDTIGPEVVDAFYIQRENGRRIEDPDEQGRLRDHVSAAIAELDG